MSTAPGLPEIRPHISGMAPILWQFDCNLTAMIQVCLDFTQALEQNLMSMKLLYPQIYNDKVKEWSTSYPYGSQGLFHEIVYLLNEPDKV